MNDLQRKRETRNTSTKVKTSQNKQRPKTSRHTKTTKKQHGTPPPKKKKKLNQKISETSQALSGLLNQANIQLVPAATFGVLDEAMGPDGFGSAPCGWGVVVGNFLGDFWYESTDMTDPKKISMVSICINDVISFLISWKIECHPISAACPWITTTSYFWMSCLLAKHQVAGVVQIYSSAPWPNQMLSEEDFVPPAVHNSPEIRSIYFWKLRGLRNYVVLFFHGQIRRPFWGSLPWLAFLDDIPRVMFLWGGICFEFLGKSHGVKGSIPREGVVDVIFSRQNLQRYDCPSDEFQMEKW